jgi:hypothetical protein
MQHAFFFIYIRSKFHDFTDNCCVHISSIYLRLKDWCKFSVRSHSYRFCHQSCAQDITKELLLQKKIQQFCFNENLLILYR